MLPVLFPQQLKFLCERARDENAIDLLIHEDLTEILEEDYTTELEILKDNSVQISSSVDLPRFGLTIVDTDAVWVTVHRYTGVLYGLFENSNSEAVFRAQQLFEQYLKDSQQYQKLRA